MFGPGDYAFIRRHAIGSTDPDLMGFAIVDLSKLATAENIVDILSVIHHHLKSNPADCAIHDWPPSSGLKLAIHCLRGVDEIQTLNLLDSDIVVGKQLRLGVKRIWPDVWRWIEAIITIALSHPNQTETEKQTCWRTSMLEIAIRLTTIFLAKGHLFYPQILSTDGFIERMLDTWLYIFRNKLESSQDAGHAMLCYFLSERSPQSPQHRGKLVRCLETYELKRGIGTLMNHVRSCSLYSVNQPLLLFVECVEVSTILRRQILPLDPLALMFRIISGFTSQSFVDSCSDKEVTPATTTIIMSLRIFEVLIESGSIMWVKNALDNDILLHILRTQRFIKNLSMDAVSFEELGVNMVEKLAGKLYFTLLGFRPYTLYPSVLRRISRAIKSVERLELLEKYGVEVEDRASQASAIGAAWALLCSEVKVNERLLSCEGDYAHRLCASVSCPHKSHRISFTLLRCSGCQQVFYCSRSCQIIDWKRKPEHLSHKVVCARIIDDRRACIGLPVNDMDLFAASKIALTRAITSQKDPVRKLIRKFNLSRSQSEEDRLDDSAAYCSLVTVRLECREYPLKARVLSFLEVLSLYPEEEEHKEALLSGSLSSLPSGWVDAFKAAKEKDLTLVYTMLPNSSLSRTVVVGPWNAHTGTRERD
ncbi:hypothetical protein BT96DRAFT_1013445 [Gymnopus androsaceus JB14]|uniref:MYND-type domain-containing protein n=1 Tax=Gymnopus androsaceus JB14 TaxID=1447944 RepID=A0A6A4IIH3_9AGAR|nr:hypothetical protein BT96DRAFT_1013445 [Gymnopus androsaceus JB14]